MKTFLTSRRLAQALFMVIVVLFFSPLKAQIQIGADIDGIASTPLPGMQAALSTDGSTLVIGESAHNQVRVFENEHGNWTQIGNAIEGENIQDYSGHSVAISGNGNVVAIGAPFHSGRQGSLRVFENVNNAWVQIGGDIVSSDFVSNDQLGWTVAINGDGTVVMAGVLGPERSQSPAYVYRNENGSWKQIGEDIKSYFNNGDQSLAASMSADGSVVAFGFSGNVGVYKNENGEWKQVGELIKDGESNEYESSRTISLSADGNVIAIGSPIADGEKGLVRVYQNNNGSWEQLGSDITGVESKDKFGFSVSLNADGRVIAVLAPEHDSGKGHTRIYKYHNIGWNQITSDIDGATDYDGYHASISLSADGSRIAIASPDPNNGQGYVRVFQLPQQATNYAPVGVTGFNQDLVAEGTGGDAEAVTTVAFDTDAPLANHVFYTKEYRYGSGTGTDGLPNDGIINSESNPGIAYQMAAYDGNNALMLEYGESGELSFATPHAFSKLSILTASANGDASLEVTLLLQRWQH